MLTVKQAAKHLGISYMSVLRLIHAGQLEAVNISPGRRQPNYRVEPDAIQGFKQANLVKPTT